jgi:hypothetical protein
MHTICPHDQTMSRRHVALLKVQIDINSKQNLDIFSSMSYSYSRTPAPLVLLPSLNENAIETRNSRIRIRIPSSEDQPNDDRVNLLHQASLLHLVSHKQDSFRHALAVISPPPQRLGQGQLAARISLPCIESTTFPSQFARLLLSDPVSNWCKDV